MNDQPQATDQDLVDERTAARYLALSPHTLGDMRRKGRGPSFYKLGGKTIRYALSDLNDYCQRTER
jgi:predicted DNA-binding transcriptional regulator AlpA